MIHVMYGHILNVPVSKMHDIANKSFNCLECTDDRKDFIH